MVSNARTTPPAGYESPKLPKDLAPKASTTQLVMALCALATLFVALGGKFYASREELIAIAVQQKTEMQAVDARFKLMQTDLDRRVEELRKQGDDALKGINSTFDKIDRKLDRFMLATPRRKGRDDE